MASKAYLKLRELLVCEGLRAGQFVSMPDLVKLLSFPPLPTREAVKRAGAVALLSVMPKGGVQIMAVTSATTR